MAPRTDLKIMTWNCNTLKNKNVELSQTIIDYNLHVIGLNETRLDDNYGLNVQGFNCYRCDRNSEGGGVALLVHKNINQTKFYLPKLASLEAVAARIKTNNGHLLIVSIYLPPDRSLDPKDLNKITNLSDNVIIFGDFNCKHPTWNCFGYNSNGKKLLNYCTNNNLIIHAPDEPTYYPPQARFRPSVIDLYVTKNFNNISKPQSLSILSSDHNPVLANIGTNYNYVNNNKTYDFKNANFKLYKQHINTHLNLSKHLDANDDIDQAISNLQDIILEAFRISVPLVNPKIYYDSVPNNIKQLIKLKNHFRRKFQKTRKNEYNKIYKILCNNVNLKLTAWKNSCWENKIKNLEPGNKSLWKMSKYLYKKKSAIPPLKNNQNILYDNKQKAQALAQHFYDIHCQNLNINSATHTRTVNKQIKTYFNNNPQKFLDADLCNYKEIQMIIKKLKNNKAPGNDSITNLQLKHLPNKGIVQIVKIINAIFLNAYFPNTWKLAKIIPVPKPGKCQNTVQNYRPISLLPCLSKVVERALLRRLLDHIEATNLLIPEQFGFKRSHSTTDQLTRLTDYITHNFNRKKYCGLVLLDIEKAFDSVWHNGLLSKLINYDFPPYTIHLLKSYITDRKFQVTINNELSFPRTIVAGVPQGSVLGPVLFNLYINDIPKSNNTKLSLFADDTALITSSWRLSAIVNNLNTTVHKIFKFFVKWRLKLNELKTEFIILTKRRPDLSNITIKVNNTNINPSNEVKYLGVLFDSKLTFTKHINKSCTTANKILRMIYPIYNRRSKLSQKNKLIIFKTIIRPVLTYGCPAWQIASKSNIKNLQIIQNHCLRIIGRYPRYERINTMHENINIEFIDEYIKKLTKKYFERIATHDNILIQNIGESYKSLNKITHPVIKS